MRIDSLELLALNKAFQMNDSLDSFIKSHADKFIVLERTYTGVGLFSLIECIDIIPKPFDRKIWDWNFDHPAFSNGGSFIVTIENDHRIMIEMISFVGTWPENINLSEFRELVS